jgi:hypothetical protein
MLPNGVKIKTNIEFLGALVSTFAVDCESVSFYLCMVPDKLSSTT